ncbi:MAG: SMP-30/gluconolactonase/LRE family protein [Pseudoxanthomonas sp.]
MTISPFRILALASTLCFLGCVASGAQVTSSASAFGKLTALDPSFHQIVPADSHMEKIADGFTWSEGPAWVKDGGYLLFNDVPQNTMYRWTKSGGPTVFLKPSGLAQPDPLTVNEAGANGLFLENQGTMLLADSGSRLVARMDLATKRKTTLAASIDGKRFNSPNDVVAHHSGVVFFTDPPYGLKELDDSPIKELSVNGIYRIDVDGSVRLIDDSLSFPNGIALSPDERTLYVSNSDPARPIWMAYSLDAQAMVTGKRLFGDASDLLDKKLPGLPDGMAISEEGNIFATAPGGILVMDATGKRLGRIETGGAISNCAFGDDGSMLYMTSHTLVSRIRVNARGLGFKH